MAESVISEEESDIEEKKKKRRNVRETKVASKKQKTVAASVKKSQEGAIVHKYFSMDGNDESDESEYNGSDDGMQGLEQIFEDNTSTPVRKRKQKAMTKQEKYVKYLEWQLQCARKGAVDMHKVYQEAMSEKENINSQASSSHVDPFTVHDKIYEFNREKPGELETDNEGRVHLGEGVYCTRNAYDSSFKTDCPAKCLNSLSEGIYGLDDLSKRTVRMQGNTAKQNSLSPLKKRIVEKHTYIFMRAKDFTINQVDLHCKRFNTMHRQAITYATNKLKRDKKLEEQSARERKELKEMLAATRETEDTM